MSDLLVSEDEDVTVEVSGEFLTLLKDATPFCGPPELPIIDAVRLRSVDGALQIVATDSYALLFAETGVAVNRAVDVLLDKRDALDLVKSVGKTVRVGDFGTSLTFANGKLVVRGPFGERVYNTVEGEYPNVDRLSDGFKSIGCESIGFGGPQLVRIGKLAGKGGAKFELGGDKPTQVTFPDRPGLIVLQMPYRV